MFDHAQKSRWGRMFTIFVVGLLAMVVPIPRSVRRSLRRTYRSQLLVASLLISLVPIGTAQAGKVGWLDDVVQEVVREAKAGGRVAARGGDGATASTKAAGRLFAGEAGESLESLARRHDDIARFGRSAEPASDVLMQTRFARLLKPEPEMVRTFAALSPAERRLVVEVGEAAQRLALRYPGQADTMIRALGTEGLSAVRVYGDDVAEVIVKEGPGSVDVLRKTGRGGWKFFTETVLPNKGKLAAAGVLAAFLAAPDKFVDTAGRVTEYAVAEFAKAGLSLGGAATRGLESAVGSTLAAYGLNFAAARYLGMGLAGCVIVLATMVLIGLPVAWALRPFTGLARLASAPFRRSVRVG
ncbi:hypothetical protein EP7_005410 [Isosphaeraceae bacterium EP7]